MPFEGVYSVLPTPFRGGGEVDIESLKRVVDLIVAAGVNGVTALGVTGEAARLSERERGVIVDTVVRQVAGRAKVIVDGAFARGTDIVKAIAAGASLVGLGRMQCYALGAGGEGALVRMLELIEDEVQRCLGMLGVTRFADLDRSYLHPAPPTVSPHVLSAFPLLKIEDYRY